MTMNNFSENFKRSEFECRCGCGLDTVDAELVRILELVRAMFGNKDVIISSGCRCNAHNKAVGGSKGSWHTKCRAVDFNVSGVKPGVVADLLERLFPSMYGIGRYAGWTHLDTRPGVARWKG